MTYTLRTHWDGRVDAREVSDPCLLIGRGAAVHLRLDDGAVGFQHARIERIEGRYVLSDDQSLTGTYVNGVRIQKKPLADGDRIMIGPYLLTAALAAAGGPLCLDIRRASGGPEPQPARAAAPGFDYALAYALKRRFLNKTVVTLFLLSGSAFLLLLPVRAGRNDLFRAGRVSGGHAIFANQCERCHQPWQGPSQARCQDCHGPSIHHREQVFVPACQSCHAEHREQGELTAVANRQCVSCHADLKSRDGKPPRFERRVTDFAADHPEFAIRVKADSRESRVRLSDKGARQADPTRIKLNHALHLKPGLKGAKGPARLFCGDCHVPSPDGALMMPLRYDTHCKDCHRLTFAPELPGRVVPHAAPDVVDAYLVGAYAGLAGQPASAAAGLGPARKVREIEARLFQSVCGECHELAQKQGLPQIQKPDMPERWFRHARFSHGAHRVLQCNACHTRASRSRRSAELLLPGIEICQQCHRNADSGWLLQEAAAPKNCVTCHVYHEKPASNDWDGPLTVRRLLEREEAKAGPAADQASSLERYLKALGGLFAPQQDRP